MRPERMLQKIRWSNVRSLRPSPVRPARVAFAGAVPCLVFVLVFVAAASAAGAPPANADETQSLLTIAHGDYRLPTLTFLHRRDRDWHHNDDLVVGDRYFARVAVEDEMDGLRFAVEEPLQEKSSEFCYELGCYAVKVGVRENSGLMYLYLDKPRDNPWRPYQIHIPTTAFEPRTVELSVAQGPAGPKVYREVVVSPSTDAPDCTDYPQRNPDLYTCLFLGERLPAERPETSQEMRDGLPNLVQPASNYSLLVAEEFEGPQDNSGDCANGMANINSSVWSFDSDPCNNTGRDGVPCFNVEDGHIYFTVTGTCGGAYLSSIGKLLYRYGYLETKYTTTLVPDPHDEYVNVAFVQYPGSSRFPLKYHYRDFGVKIENYADLTRYFGVEIDFFEYFPRDGTGTEYTAQFLNYPAFVYNYSLKPRHSKKIVQFCPEDTPPDWHMSFMPADRCRIGAEITVTKGIEWTPRGYRTFFKVDGVHDDFYVVPEDKMRLTYLPAGGPSDNVSFSSTWQATSNRESYFEYQTQGSADSILEQYGIAHMPAIVDILAWGRRLKSTSVRAPVRIDYIRIFQPENSYADMEPVHQ